MLKCFRYDFNHSANFTLPTTRFCAFQVRMVFLVRSTVQRHVTSTTAIMISMLRLKKIIAFNFKGFLLCSRQCLETYENQPAET